MPYRAMLYTPSTVGRPFRPKKVRSLRSRRVRHVTLPTAAAPRDCVSGPLSDYSSGDAGSHYSSHSAGYTFVSQLRLWLVQLGL